jgi:hypothetical protein
MSNVLIPGRHAAIGGISGSHQAPVSRELLFEALTSPTRPTLIVLADDKHDDSIIQNSATWAKARGTSFAKEQIIITDALQRASDLESFAAMVDDCLHQRPCSAPVFYRDRSAYPYAPARWPTWASHLCAKYRAAACLSVVQLGPHALASVPLLDVPADVHWRCEDNQRHVTLKCIETGETIEWMGKPIIGGLIFNRKQEEATT